MKKWLMALACCLLSQGPVVAQSFTWNTLRTGAGGWVTGMDIHPSGNPVYCRVDVGSAYRYDPVQDSWVNIVSSSTLPAGELDWQQYGGVLSIVSAPSDPDIAYLAYDDGVFRSDNQGDTWTRTNMPFLALLANDDASKLSGERLAVDPLNADVVYFGSIFDGLWRTLDGGSSWGKVNAIPDGASWRGVRQVLFDRSSGNLNGRTATLYVTVDSIGMYQSTNGGQTWQNVSAGEPELARLVFLDSEIDSTGQVYLVGYNDITLTSVGIRRFDGNNWDQPLATPTTLLNVAIDPFNLDRVIALSEGFEEIFRSTNVRDANPSWEQPGYTRKADNIPWLSWTEGNWFTIGEMEFDPSQANRLWIAEGTATWTIDNPGAANLIWEERALGQEHLVSNDLVVNGKGEQITAHWDRALFLHETEGSFPETHLLSPRFNSAWDLDVSPSDPDFLVAIVEDHRYCCYDAEHRNSGYSTDGGQSWTKFASQPELANTQGIYGNIAVSADDNDNIVWLPSNNRPPYYSTNRGQSWTQISLPNNPSNCCHLAPFLYKKALTADRVLPHTFYIYNWENGSIYRTNDGGANWSEHTALADFYGWHGKLLATPGHAEHLWYMHGAEDMKSFMQPLKRTTDGGLTWTSLVVTSEVLNMALGAPLNPGGYPIVFIQGRVNGEWGYWMSTDEGANWTRIGLYPENIYDIAKVMEGDPYIPTRLYVGFGGNGFVYGQDEDVVGPISIRPNLQILDLSLYHDSRAQQLHLLQEKPIAVLSLYSLDGRLVRREHQPAAWVSTAGLAPGLYLVHADKAVGKILIQ